MRHAVIGPRGGEGTADVSCDTCVCATSCAFSGPHTRRWGCSMWVNEIGQRVKLTPRIESMPDEEFEKLTPTEQETAEGIDAIASMPDTMPEEEHDGQPGSDC